MKVLFDYQAFIQQVGGVSRYHCELIAKLPQYGITPCLPWILSDNIYMDNIRVKHGHFLQGIKSSFRTNIYKWIDQKLMLQAMDKEDWDVFHPTFVNPYYIKHLHGKPVIVTVHDLIHEKTERSDSEVVKKKRRIQLSHTDAVISISEETKRDLLHFYGDIVDESKVTVIYHGVNQQIVHCKTNPIINQPYILYIGTRNNHKNFSAFAKAFAQVYKDVLLVCTGKPFSKEESEYLSKLGIRERIRQKFVTDEELQNLLCNALALIYPSTMEGFGLPILEAFRCGCPTIISDILCFHEVAGDAAEYFNPQNVDSMASIINKTITDTEYLSQLRELGYERLKLFTWEKTAIQTAEVYKNVYNCWS